MTVAAGVLSVMAPTNLNVRLPATPRQRCLPVFREIKSLPSENSHGERPDKGAESARGAKRLWKRERARASERQQV